MASHPRRQNFYEHRCKQLVFHLVLLSATEESVNHLPEDNVPLLKRKCISADLKISNFLSKQEEVR